MVNNNSVSSAPAYDFSIPAYMRLAPPAYTESARYAEINCQIDLEWQKDLLHPLCMELPVVNFNANQITISSEQNSLLQSKDVIFLDTISTSFPVKILKMKERRGDFVAIGFASRQTAALLWPGFEDNSIAYYSNNGHMYCNNQKLGLSAKRLGEGD